MKKIRFSFGILVFLSFILCQKSLQSQDRFKPIADVGIEIGYYKPSLDYWNEKSSLEKWSSEFNGSTVFLIFLDINFSKYLTGRFQAGIWNKNVDSGNIIRPYHKNNYQVQMTLIPLSIDALVPFPMLSINNIEPYAGIGGGICLIEVLEYPSPLADYPVWGSHKGRNYLWKVIVGAKRPISKDLNAGIEYCYIFGKYTQQVVNTFRNAYDEDVSLSGPQIKVYISLNME
ncbi:MAG: hypothetical protein P9X24_18995 [Candidatus Hatepunaea meridiana]|nr:hypothetical protein [Candidatus Hatepunaea meridiana]